MDTTSDRLTEWVKRVGGEQLPTEGGDAEDVLSPSTPGQRSMQPERQQQLKASGIAVDLVDSAAADDIKAEDGPDHVKAENRTDVSNPDYLEGRKLRPLSGSTVGSSITDLTANGSSAIPSKRHSSGNPREVLTSQPYFELDAPPHISKARRVGSADRADTTIATEAIVNPFDENTPLRQPTTTFVEGSTARRNPSFHHPILATTDQSSEDDSEAPRNIGCLKRTISILDFENLTPETRTACPPSEATDVPPAYARPRSEVGLPPLPLKEEEEELDEQDSEGDDGKEERGRSRSRSRSKRPLSAQEYLSKARIELKKSNSLA
jgi:hypothetical protein